MTRRKYYPSIYYNPNPPMPSPATINRGHTAQLALKFVQEGREGTEEDFIEAYAQIPHNYRLYFRLKFHKYKERKLRNKRGKL